MSDFHYSPGKDSLPRVQTADGTDIPLNKLLNIDPDAVRADFQHVPGWQAAVAYAASLAKLRVDIKRRKIKEMESAKYIQMREILSDKLEKPPSEALIMHNVNVDPEIRNLYRELFDLERSSGALEAAKYAMYTRRDILIQMGAETRLDRKQNV